LRAARTEVLFPSRSHLWLFYLVVPNFGIVAGGLVGLGRKSAEMYDEELNRRLRLPCDLPYESSLYGMGSAVL
jgi:hypothetical protein